MNDKRNGICINVGNCRQADNKIKQEISIAADFVCSECGRDLIPLTEKGKMKLSKPMLIAIPILVLLLGGAGYGWYYYSRAKAVVQTTENAINKTSDVVLNDIKPAVLITTVQKISDENKNIAHIHDHKQQQAESKRVYDTYKDSVSHDWHAGYELMKTLIYSGDHHDAFHTLADLAKEAINGGYSKSLIDALNADIAIDKTQSNPEYKTIGRLVTHHDDWDPIIHALMDNNASGLHDDDK